MYQSKKFHCLLVTSAILMSVAAHSHDGDPGKIHACVRNFNQMVRIVAPDDDCSGFPPPGGWTPIHWDIDSEDDDWSGAGSGIMTPAYPDDLVVIGIENGSAKLHVETGYDDSQDVLRVHPQGRVGLLVDAEARVVVGETSGSLARFTINSDEDEDAVRVRVDEVTHFAVKADGQVGVGTSVPDARLEVKGRQGENPFIVRTQSTDPKFLVNAAGNVGIGAPEPADKLVVVQSGSERAGFFEIDNAANQVAALSSITRGRGSAVFANVLNPVSTSAAIFARNSGRGPAAQFDRGDVRILNGNVGIGTSEPESMLSVISSENALNGNLGSFEMTNAESSIRPLEAITAGKGQAAFFTIRNPENNQSAVVINSDSKGGALFGFANGPTGSAGTFRIFNPVSDSDALRAQTDGSGSSLFALNLGSGAAGVFEVTQTDNASPAVHATTAGSGPAGRFDGNVVVNGTLVKSAGLFRIDHPLDPENKYLNHSFVESSEMMNVYAGTVRLDRWGQALIELPDWFEALNRDFRYQLTPIGAPAPELHVAKEMSRNAFAIAGGHEGLKVSWQVTGVRHDDYANANRIKVEELKPVVSR